tara:strand:+ start:4416 stop:5195 length:780 start_codon:yes stop_codon:yes gene_type:complete
MKKIAILISGQIRIFEKNIDFFEDLKKSLSDYEITIVSSVWENQNEIELFKKKYNIKFINQVKEQDWTNQISKVKYVTWEENSGFKIPNVFHMWYSIVENVNFLEKIIKEDGLNFDYVLRFRTDIICKDGLSFLSNEVNQLKDNEILFPSNLHWKGLNDSFFISNFNTFLEFKNFLSFLEKFVMDNRVFDPEYILYSFVNENNFKIKLINNFNLALIRIEDSKPTKIVYVPFKDRIQIKIARQKIKLLKLYNKIKFIIK